MKYFILVNDGGIITSVDPASGKLLQEGRSRDAIGEYYASPVAADNKVFLANVDGKMTVLQAGARGRCSASTIWPRKPTPLPP